jgi:hypothetical protein
LPLPDPQILGSLAAGAVFAAVFLVMHRFRNVTTSLIRRRSAFADMIRPEPGDDRRRLLRALDGRVGAHLGAGFVLLSVSVITATADPRDWWSELEHWGWWFVAMLLCAMALCELRSLWRLAGERRRAGRELEAQIAVGQRLQHVAARGNYLFHCVPVGDDRIDHLVLGTNGLYAVHVVLEPPRGTGRARVEGNSVEFGGVGPAYPLARWQAAVRRLRRELERDVSHPVNILSVIVVPGWEVETAEQGGHLLVNHVNLPVMTGWRDQQAFLMDDEVEVLERALAARVSG